MKHCRCLFAASLRAPFYTHLGTARSISAMRTQMEMTSGLTGSALRVQKLVYTGKEATNAQGCPSAKSVLRRRDSAEKILLLVRQRPGHVCETSVMVVAIVCWEALEQERATYLYDFLRQVMITAKKQKKRGCATNKQRSCLCQGVDEQTNGTSFSFGCAWSAFTAGCKFGASKDAPSKYKLYLNPKDTSVELQFEKHLQALATDLSPLLQTMVPEAYRNMTASESVAESCRLGTEAGRPFSSATVCLDFCAHSHRDSNNLTEGCTMIVTLTKPQGFGPCFDEQLHTLPLYNLDEQHRSIKKRRCKRNPVVTSDRHQFKAGRGIGIALEHRSVMIEYAKRDLHATTAVRHPNRSHPTRISVILYQHSQLNRKNHGAKELQEKIAKRKYLAKQQEAQNAGSSETDPATVSRWSCLRSACKHLLRMFSFQTGMVGDQIP